MALYRRLHASRDSRGGGVDVNDGVAVRSQADYRLVLFGDPADSSASLVSADGEDFNEFRFAVGLVFRVGG